MDSSDKEHSEVSFRLCGQPHEMLLHRFVVVRGLYYELETRTTLYTQALKQAPLDQLKAWWPVIGVRHFGCKSRVTNIRDRLYRYLHRLMATSIIARGKGYVWCSPPDLFFMWCLMTHKACHSATWLAVWPITSQAATKDGFWVLFMAGPKSPSLPALSRPIDMLSYQRRSSHKVSICRRRLRYKS